MKFFKSLLLFIITFIILLTETVSAEPAKVMSLNYDNSSSLLFISTESTSVTDMPSVTKFVHLENPNRIYFDINNAILIGSKQQLVFDKSSIKEVKIAQFSTEPNIVRSVITFEEDFDTSNVKIISLNGNIVVKTGAPSFINDYFNTIYDEAPEQIQYSGIIANSQLVQKTQMPIENNLTNKSANSVMDDIYKAFASSTLNNSDGKTYDKIISVDISADLKLRTKYYINDYTTKNGGILISGLGQLTSSKSFTLDSPKRVVIDLPNTYVDKKIRNKELNICPDGSCKDSAKIGQFEYNKARIVITTEKPEKYLSIYSPDAQSMFIINADKLNHATLSTTGANIQKAYTNRINSKTNELIFSFTTPVIHSIVRKDNAIILYLFNVKSYNEPDLIKTLNSTAFSRMTLSLLPQTGVKAEMKINPDDTIKIAQSFDGRAIRLTINSKQDVQINKSQKENEAVNKPKQAPIKNKIVLDPGHGGTDYGAIREGINEKDITLEITQRVASLLKSKGYKVSMTRTDDTYLGLQDRCDINAEENPEIFVSIHVNSAVATEPFGIETHYYHEESKELAEIIQKNLMKNIDTKNRGIIKSKFYVINHTDIPSVLVETGFLSNPNERAELVTDKRKQTTAKAIADGIIEYLKSNR